MRMGFTPAQQHKNTKQSAFSGKLHISTLEMDHAVTERVKQAVKAAPDHITIHISEVEEPAIPGRVYIPSNEAKVGFSSPKTNGNPINLVTRFKDYITERDILHVLKTAIKADKSGHLPPNSYL